MPPLHRRHLTVLSLAVALGLGAVSGSGQERGRDWTPATHGELAPPDYARLFSTDRVHELRITIPVDRFDAMQADVREVATVPFGPRGGPGRGGGGRGGVQLTSRDPIYVPVTVEHEGRRWTNVGMRYKGNSSLAVLVQTGNGKLPFRLNFDRYEEAAPETRNQRFYGFQELTFSPNFGDDSQIRELLAGEVFRDRGVPAPRAAFYRVFVDAGSGPQYHGLYTMIEDPSDGAMLQAQFGSREGNLYKPDGPGADWTTFDAAGFERKANGGREDFADIQAALSALHAPPTPAAAWRAQLERVFDVDLFLRWLAVNTALNNWDAYGALAHNYFLYADPRQDGRLRWIPWDLNEALRDGSPMAGGPRGRGPFGPPPGGFPGVPPGGFPGGPPGGPGPFGGNPNDVLHAGVSEDWPLIQRLLADPVYQAKYRLELGRSLEGLMAPEALLRRARELHRLVTPFVTGPQGERASHTTISSPAAFTAGIDGPGGLAADVAARRTLVQNVLRPAAR